jgi:uncharacterized membrane-anchored protein YitT (DUF2179 family)
MRNKKFLTDFIFINLGFIVAALPAVIFFSRINLPPGGMYSMAMIIYNMFSDYLKFLGSTSFATGFIALMLNIPLLILGYMTFGRDYLLKVSFACFAYPAYTMLIGKILDPILLNYQPNLFTAIALGGILLGTGVGITIFFGANTGGTDILGQVLNYYMPNISLGSSIAFFNILIMVISAFIIGVKNTLAGVVVILVISSFVDFTLKALKSIRG